MSDEWSKWLSLIAALLLLLFMAAFAYAAVGTGAAFGIVGFTMLIGAFSIKQDTVAFKTGSFRTGMSGCQHDFRHKVDTNIPQCAKCGVWQE